jgi:hypothetical protein
MRDLALFARDQGVASDKQISRKAARQAKFAKIIVVDECARLRIPGEDGINSPFFETARSFTV